MTHSMSAQAPKTKNRMDQQANPPHYLALSGGVGGAKLALGLSHVLPAEQLTIVANTGDDFEHLGLTICPDIDTLLYTLADLNNKALGWGRQDESWHFMETLKALGAETWFQLGDRDLALHTIRTQKLAHGETLSQVTHFLCQQLGISPNVTPMTDDPLKTIVKTTQGPLAFQHYFVREQCRPAITGIEFEGRHSAQPSAAFLHALHHPHLKAVIICPSNPFVSIAPIRSLPGIEERLNARPVIAVSPIIAGKALKGPAAKMMQELKLPCTALGVCEYYGSLLDGFVLDEADAHYSQEMEAHGVRTLTTQTVMRTLNDRIQLAEEVITWINTIWP